MLDAKGFYQSFSLNRSAIPSFDKYPFNLKAVRELDKIVLHPKVTFFIGENGSGKSTLIEALAIKAGFNPEGGSRNFNFSTRASHSSLHKYIDLELNTSRLERTLIRPKDGYFLRAESYFNVATEIENLDKGPGGPPLILSYGGVSLHAQSHGESFFALLNTRLKGNGFYIFDEPEAALSPQRQLSLLVIMHRLLKANSQMVIATHSPILMAYPEAFIYELGDGGVRKVAYTDTEHYKITREFLNRPEKMLENLFRPGEEEAGDE